MPLIKLTTSKQLTEEEKEILVNEFSNTIDLIPNKTKKVLMITFDDNKSIYFDDEKLSNGANLDLRLYKKADFEAKQKWTRKAFEILEKNLLIKEEDVYIQILEYDTWGTKGDLR